MNISKKNTLFKNCYNILIHWLLLFYIKICLKMKKLEI